MPDSIVTRFSLFAIIAIIIVIGGGGTYDYLSIKHSLYDQLEDRSSFLLDRATLTVTQLLDTGSNIDLQATTEKQLQAVLASEAHADFVSALYIPGSYTTLTHPQIHP